MNYTRIRAFLCRGKRNLTLEGSVDVDAALVSSFIFSEVPRASRPHRGIQESVRI